MQKFLAASLRETLLMQSGFLTHKTSKQPRNTLDSHSERLFLCAFAGMKVAREIIVTATDAMPKRESFISLVSPVPPPMQMELSPDPLRCVHLAHGTIVPCANMSSCMTVDGESVGSDLIPFSDFSAYRNQYLLTVRTTEYPPPISPLFQGTHATIPAWEEAMRAQKSLKRPAGTR